HIAAVEIDRAGARLLDGFLLLAELARMKDPDLVASAGALRDHPAHVVERLDRRIVRTLGVGGPKLARDRIRRDRRQRQQDDEGCDPPKAGAVVQRQLQPLGMVSADGKKGSTGWSWTGARRTADGARKCHPAGPARSVQLCAAGDFLAD